MSAQEVGMILLDLALGVGLVFGVVAACSMVFAYCCDKYVDMRMKLANIEKEDGDV